jgi:hypothetical protein
LPFLSNKFWLQGPVVSTWRLLDSKKLKAPVVDIIRRPHAEDVGTQENAGRKHRPDPETDRGRYPAEGFQYGAIARFASLISATRFDEVKAPHSGGAFSWRRHVGF